MKSILSGFDSVAPFLSHPLVLVGFALLLFTGMGRLLIRSNKLPRLAKTHGFALLKQVLNLGFFLALLVTVLGFVFATIQLFVPVEKTSLPNVGTRENIDIDGQGQRLVRKTESETVYTYWNLPKVGRILQDDAELRFEPPTELQTIIRTRNPISKLAELRGHGSDVRAVAFNPKGRIVATGGEDSCVGLWDLENWKSLGTIAGFKGTIRALAFSEDGKRLSVAGESSSVFVLDTERFQASTRFSTARSSIKCVAFSPDTKMLAAVGSGPAHVWKMDGKQEVAQFEALPITPSYAYGTAFSARGSAYAIGFHGGGTIGVSEFVRFWRSVTNQSGLDLVGNNDRTIGLSHDDVVGSLRFSPDGRLLARATRAQNSFNRGAGAGGSLLVWDLEHQLERKSYALPYGNYYSMCFFADTNVLIIAASGKPDSTRRTPSGSSRGSKFICIWDSLTQRPLAFETEHASGVASSAISSDCKFLATSGVDSPTVIIWQIGALQKEASNQTEANENRLTRIIEMAAKDSPRFRRGDEDIWRKWLKDTLSLNPDIHSIRELKEFRWSTTSPSVGSLLNFLDERLDDAQ